MKKPKPDKWKIADIAARFQISTTTARDILKRAGLTAGEGGVDVIAAARAFVDHYRNEAAGPELEAAADRARKAKAEADAAEIDTAKKKEELVLKADVDMMWQDAIQQGVENVSNLSGLSKAQKQSVFAAIRKIKLKENGD